MATTNTTTKKNKKMRYLLSAIVIICLVAALAISLSYVLNKKKAKTTKVSESDYHTMTYQGKEYSYNTSLISILLLGIDYTNETNTQGQSDAIELLLLNREKKTIQLLALPRDTMTPIQVTDISGKNLGWTKNHLNLAYAYGTSKEEGCMYAMQAVSKLLGNVPITKYGSMNIKQIKMLQNVVGTLQVTIPNNSLTFVDHTWVKGRTITINSSNVEKFVRTRNTKQNYSAMARMERQKVYMKAYFMKIKTMLSTDFNGTIKKMYQVIQQITTNISYSDMVDFGNMALKYSFDDNSYYTLKGKSVTTSTYDEFHYDDKALKSLIKTLFYE